MCLYTNVTRRAKMTTAPPARATRRSARSKAREPIPVSIHIPRHRQEAPVHTGAHRSTPPHTPSRTMVATTRPHSQFTRRPPFLEPVSSSPNRVPGHRRVRAHGKDSLYTILPIDALPPSQQPPPATPLLHLRLLPFPCALRGPCALLGSCTPLRRPYLELREVHPVCERNSRGVFDVREPFRRPPDAYRNHGEGFQSGAAFHPVGDAIARLHVPVSRKKNYSPARLLDIP